MFKGACAVIDKAAYYSRLFFVICTCLLFHKLCQNNLSSPTHLSNSAHTTLNFITRVRAGEVGVAHYPKWRRSLLRFSLETWDGSKNKRTIAWGRYTPLTIVDQFDIKIRGFTLSCEALGRLLKKKKKNMMMKMRMSDFSCEYTKVCMDS